MTRHSSWISDESRHFPDIKARLIVNLLAGWPHDESRRHAIKCWLTGELKEGQDNKQKHHQPNYPPVTGGGKDPC